ncbi:MAG TPA: argininosuccinate synthase [Spirochaetia bacterium]|nr:MAG: argininosuccinate synthase [Spirochaetes bacterium GWB1_36_13]HCL57477.1 argininosuccinate synthase [Spirochaetia bacterium]
MKVVLAYSGGLDTSIILKWLQDKFNAEVIAYCADVGQEEELDGLEEKALKTGAKKLYIEDLKDEFAKDYIYKAIKAGAIYEDRYLLGTSIARPIIAKKQAEIAIKENADAVAHGATGKGNDQVRFELTFKALAPHLQIIAPWRDWEFDSRESLIDYAKEKGIHVPVSKEKPYSMDRNLMHISYEGGILEDPYREPEENMFLLTNSIDKAPNQPEYVEIVFEKGEAVSLNGEKLSPYLLIKKANELGKKHGIGRVDIVENRLVGIKSRGVYETPGVTILMNAHQALETITLEKETYHYKQSVALKYAEMIYNGQWFHPLRIALDQFIDSTQEMVNGVVRIKLYKGHAAVVGRKSDNSLYNPQLATFEKGADYSQKDAEGFINLYGLPLKEYAMVRTKFKK